MYSLVAVNVDELGDFVVCSHSSAYHYFLDSINNTACTYTSYPCQSQVDFDAGKCLNCTTRGCNHMGLWASKSNDNGGLYLTTQSGNKPPYCKK